MAAIQSTKPKHKRGPGRPSLASLGLKPRDRHNLNVERSPQLDNDLAFIRQEIARHRGVKVEVVTQKEALLAALRNYATMLLADKDGTVCPKCNGLGHVAIKNGDNDEVCECCGQPIDLSDIPY